MMLICIYIYTHIKKGNISITNAAFRVIQLKDNNRWLAAGPSPPCRLFQCLVYLHTPYNLLQCLRPQRLTFVNEIDDSERVAAQTPAPSALLAGCRQAGGIIQAVPFTRSFRFAFIFL